MAASHQTQAVRFELFKSGPQLQKLLPFFQSHLTPSVSGLRVNVPNKHEGQSDELLATAKLILSTNSDADVCLHYSLKNMPSGLGPFKLFCEKAVSTGVRRILLITGTGRKPKYDSISVLEELSKASATEVASLPILGVAFSPYEDPKIEQTRLRRKLETGLVKEIWIRLGSDVDALRTGLTFLRDISEDVTIFGSVFMPSEDLLQRMRVRPWSGVYLTANNYLDSVESATKVTTEILRLYSEFGVTPLVETPVHDVEAVEQMLSLLLPTSPRPAADQEGSSAESVKRRWHNLKRPDSKVLDLEISE